MPNRKWFIIAIADFLINALISPDVSVASERNEYKGAWSYTTTPHPRITISKDGVVVLKICWRHHFCCLDFPKNKSVFRLLKHLMALYIP